MEKSFKLPVELDCPEKPQIGMGIFYGLFAFFMLPFFVQFLMADLQDPYPLTWFEFGYHVINFIVAFGLFREYLLDALFMFRLQLKDYVFRIKMALIWVAVIVGLVYVTVNVLDIPFLFTTLIGAYPLMELEITFLGGDLVWCNPLASFLCAVVLGPVTVSFLFYATVFAPACRIRPWLGYLAVLVWLAFTHLNNALTVWPLYVEVTVFAAQLPVHLLACWAYKKTNNIFSAILTLAFTNLLAWVYLMVTLLMQ